MKPAGYFVTGTDTGVGKTLVACALLRALAAVGHRTVGMKPVAAGATLTAEGLLNDDVAQLRAASTVDADLALVNSYCFEPAIAPHIAARQAGVEIDLAQISAAYTKLAAQADVVIVEGAGGLCVPLNAAEDTLDLAAQLNLPLILVVGMRLGCLNHAILSARVIAARGLAFAGWVANRIDAEMPVARENIATLAERLGAPLLAEFPFDAAPGPLKMARQFSFSGTRALPASRAVTAGKI